MSNYKVGYGKPPKQTRFRAGQSGNPKGRRKGVHNFTTDLRQTLMMPVRVNSGGRGRKVTTQKGALMLLREKALKGDKRALDLLLNLGVRFNNEMPEFSANQELSHEDRAILDAFRAELTTESESSVSEAPEQSRMGSQLERRRTSNK
jgi:Family of unknown function (DUF5681)